MDKAESGPGSELNPGSGIETKASSGTGTAFVPDLRVNKKADLNSKYSHVSPSDLDSIFFAFNRPNSPGCAVGVVDEGELVFTAGYGIANLDYNIPIRPDSRFMVASISKQFAAASLLMLEQQGLLDLDKDLRTYIPELPEFERPVTARHIIYHTSGIRDIYNLLSLADVGLDPTTTSEQALAMFGRQQRLNFEPGSQHLYSNSGYFLISVLVRKITGLSLREYTHRHFFEPIGMNATHWHDDTELVVPNRVISYLPRPYGSGQFYRGNMDRVGARGLFTTIKDFAKWDANFITNLSHLEDFNEKLTRPGVTSQGNIINYAAGLRLNRYKSLATIGHGGSYMGFRSQYLRFPRYNFSVIVFCNQSDINPAIYAYQIADLFLRDYFEDQFRTYPAVYYNESLAAEFEVSLKEGDLYLRRSGDELPPIQPEPLRMLWQDNDRFRVEQWDIRFKRGSGNRIDRLTIEAPGTGEITFRRK
ncbi:MAG: serine hydrolase domain-containing protein [Balneolales bacterium]